jgi:UrcA family protein
MVLTGTAAGDAILAQPAEQNGASEITVTAPRTVTKQVVERTATGNIELITLQRRVSYADLDLTRHADVVQLEARVNDVAKEACEDPAKTYALSDPKTPDCVRAAVADARPQLNAAIAAASRG